MLVLGIALIALCKRVETDKVITLSSNKSKLYVVQKTTYSDTLKSLMVEPKALEYINDIIIQTLIEKNEIILPPKKLKMWSHLFGRETWISHHLEIKDNVISYVPSGIEVGPYQWSPSLIIILGLLFSGVSFFVLTFRGSFPELTRVILVIMFFLICLSLILIWHQTPFDAFIFTTVIIVPGFFVTFKKPKIHSHYNKSEFERPKHKKPY